MYPPALISQPSVSIENKKFPFTDRIIPAPFVTFTTGAKTVLLACMVKNALMLAPVKGSKTAGKVVAPDPPGPFAVTSTKKLQTIVQIFPAAPLSTTVLITSTFGF